MGSSQPVGTLVDSNVLLDVLTRDPLWLSWSGEHLTHALETGPVLLNQMVYAEVSLRFTTTEQLDAALSPDQFMRANIPWPAAFLAARCYQLYRRRGGTRSAPLPDFFIGAHAAVLGLSLLTRDVARYRTYFPTLHLIHP